MTCNFRDGLESVTYNSRILSVPLQRAMILAAVTPDDDDDTFREKAALVAGALDIYVVRRIVNYRNYGYSTIVYTMFNLMKGLRNQPIEIVRDVLSEWLESEEERLDGMLRLCLPRETRSPGHCTRWPTRTIRPSNGCVMITVSRSSCTPRSSPRRTLTNGRNSTGISRRSSGIRRGSGWTRPSENATAAPGS